MILPLLDGKTILILIDHLIPVHCHLLDIGRVRLLCITKNSVVVLLLDSHYSATLFFER